MATRINIYRSVFHSPTTGKVMGEHWDFDPLDDPIPYATILAPDGAETGRMKCGDPGLFLREGAPGWSPQGAYKRACKGEEGFSLAV
jgi:hypothetical protein